MSILFSPQKLKVLTICVLVVFTMLINVSGVFAYIDTLCGFDSSSGGGGGGLGQIVAGSYECKGCNCCRCYLISYIFFIFNELFWS